MGNNLPSSHDLQYLLSVQPTIKLSVNMVYRSMSRSVKITNFRGRMYQFLIKDAALYVQEYVTSVLFHLDTKRNLTSCNLT